MAQDDVNTIHQAVTDWHEKLLSLPAMHGVLLHGPRQAPPPEERGAAVALAAQHLATCLEDKNLPDGLINDLLSVCETFTALCGVSLPNNSLGALSSPAHGALWVGWGSNRPLKAAKVKLLKAATGLPVHTTSIGRRASASYCVYESMGGWETLSAAVESLYNRMRNDQRCEVMFADANEQNLKTHTLEFLTCALGGKARFASSTLLTSQRDQLRNHGFGAGQFDALLQHMKAVMDELGIHPEVAASAIALLRCHKYMFEKRPSDDGEEEAEEELSPTPTSASSPTAEASG
ncbi:hypothetical protein VOLCADRAFT_120939 [Volvox carteri f. nagariensis]|uniref:Uncharacterized protein n=1 Tax=Volvox carteri f. nagariensis TaxID=3068 RepID=D8TXJ2_VOLCA|nr:uncharacterized protein VOLCADRAFT_120939 [Volvox carteri f. nagariensis]EFJ47732.1 hypothetical protein VOLCADRAFT_120939 [Volvox carteri f. nagariensis]|eukprot:XP_002951203.1 hypothetical protein VOLCADRAFT_120939 [Volvox carteri f. nagariensis]